MQIFPPTRDSSPESNYILPRIWTNSYPVCLQKEGFDPSAPTLFLLEELLYYNIPLVEGIRKLLRILAIATTDRRSKKKAKTKMLLTMIDQEMMDYVQSDDANPLVKYIRTIWKTDLSEITTTKEVLQGWTIQRQISTKNEEWCNKVCPGI